LYEATENELLGSGMAISQSTSRVLSYEIFCPPSSTLELKLKIDTNYIKSGQVSTLPIAKSKTRSKQNKGKHKFSSVYSERGVLLPVLTSGGEWVGVRACKNATRVPPSLCNVTKTYDPANSPPCACWARLRDMCSMRPITYWWLFGPYNMSFYLIDSTKIQGFDVFQVFCWPDKGRDSRFYFKVQGAFSPSNCSFD
jgi:hypothetical protein